jgi:FkbM family methyltransferase
VHLQAAVSRAASLLTRNPALFCQMILAKLNSARPMPPLPVRKRIGNVLFEYDLAEYHGTAPMFFGSYSLLVVNAMKRRLRRGDIFIDVGANIGYLSAVAADLVGPAGQVHAFEPVDAYFEKLRRLATLNPDYSIQLNACAAGEAVGKREIFVTREPGQSTLVPSYKSQDDIVSTIRVPVIRLDSYFAERGIGKVALIKVDAEGFELPVLRGLQLYFESNRQRPAIICEIAPRAYSLLGRSVSELLAFMKRYGYSAHDVADGVTPVDVTAIQHVDDVLFLAENR